MSEAIACENRAFRYRVPLLEPPCPAGVAEEVVAIDRGGYVDAIDLCTTCAERISLDATTRGQTVISRRGLP